MKNILLLIIKIYWKLIPKSKRRKCLFKVSCSNYVFKITKEEGLTKGVKAFLFRVKNCNPNYSLIEMKEKKIIITKKNFLLEECDINESILN